MTHDCDMAALKAEALRQYREELDRLFPKADIPKDERPLMIAATAVMALAIAVGAVAAIVWLVQS